MSATARQKTSSRRSGATFSTIGRIDAAGLLATVIPGGAGCTGPAESSRRSITWIDSARAERGRLVPIGQAERQDSPAAGLILGRFQPGDDPSRPFRIGLRQAPAKPQGDLVPVFAGYPRRFIDR